MMTTSLLSLLLEYTNKEDVIDVIKSLKEKYEAVAEDWNGNLLFGISLN